MQLKFSVLASQYLDDPQAVRRAVCWPVLVWEAPPTAGHLFSWSTSPGNAPRRPTAAEPLVLEVRKSLQACTPADRFSLGRTLDNDIVVEHPTVSRLHACFRQETHTGIWYVNDEGSHNGTWHDGTLLIPGRSAPLFDRAALRFGEVLATFLQPSAFNQFILDWLARGSAASRARVTPGGLTRGG